MHIFFTPPTVAYSHFEMFQEGKNSVALHGIWHQFHCKELPLITISTYHTTHFRIQSTGMQFKHVIISCFSRRYKVSGGRREGSGRGFEPPFNISNKINKLTFAGKKESCFSIWQIHHHILNEFHHSNIQVSWLSSPTRLVWNG